jgi:hypothetical protein
MYVNEAGAMTVLTNQFPKIKNFLQTNGQKISDTIYLTYTNWDVSHIRLSSWSRALLKRLPVVQLLKIFPAFYRTRRFITIFKVGLVHPVA